MNINFLTGLQKKIKKNRAESLTKAALFTNLRYIQSLVRSIRGALRLITSISLNKDYDDIFFVVSHKKKILYLVNSKVACSSIKKSILEMEEISSNIKGYGDVHEAVKENGLEIYKKDIHKYDLNDYFKFTVVRDPIDRLASCYVNKFCNRVGINENGFEFTGYLGGVFDRDMSFEEFVKLVCHIPDYLCDRHFRPQYHSIDNCGLKLDKIFKLEEVGSHEFFSKTLMLGKKINYSNRDDYREMYTDSLLELVVKKYEKDLSRFYH